MGNLTRILSEKYSEIVIPNTVLLILGMTLGVVGNIIILVLYELRIKDKKGERYFIPILALTDFLGCLANGLYFVLDNLFLFVFPGDALCRFLAFMLTFASGFSAHVLLSIALQRYLMICRPFGKQLTLFWRRILILAITLVSLGYSVPLLVVGGIRHENTTFLEQTIPTNICRLAVDPTLSTVVYFGLLTLITVVNIVATAGLYVPIIKVIHKSMVFKLRRKHENKDSTSVSDPISTQLCSNEPQESKICDTTQNKEEIDKHSTESKLTIKSHGTTTGSTKADTTTGSTKADTKVVRLVSETDTSKKVGGVKDISTVSDKNSIQSPDKKIVSESNVGKHDTESKAKVKHHASKEEKLKAKINLMFLIIIVAYILSYIPTLIIVVLTYSLDDFDYLELSEAGMNIWIFFSRCLLLNHIINPIVYCYFDTRLHAEFMKMFCRRRKTMKYSVGKK